MLSTNSKPMIIFFTFTMLTTVLARTSSIKAICRLCPTRSSPSVWTALPRSAPQIINKNDGRTYATKQGNDITNIFECNRSATLRIFSSSEQNRKYSSKSEIKSTATELTEEVEDAGEEIPLLEINESYLDTQKQSMELVLRRDLQARDVKVYDFRDLNLTSSTQFDTIYADNFSI